MTLVHTITLVREVVSGNTLAYGHWRNRTKDRDAWIAQVRMFGQHVPQATVRRRVILTAYRKRRLDSDNLSHGFKHGRDALVRCGLLVDDSDRWCSFEYRQHVLSEMPADLARKYGRRPLTVIELSDVSPVE